MNEIKGEAEIASILRLRGFVNVKNPLAFPEFIQMCTKPLYEPSEGMRKIFEDLGLVSEKGIDKAIREYIVAECGDLENGQKVQPDAYLPLHFDQQWR